MQHAYTNHQNHHHGHHDRVTSKRFTLSVLLLYIKYAILSRCLLLSPDRDHDVKTRISDLLLFRGTARWEKPGCTLPPVRTVVSCEKIAEKRDFIERTAPYCADASYGDIFDLCKSTAPFPKDTRTKKQLQPALEQLIVLYCGFQLQDRQWFELCRS